MNLNHLKTFVKVVQTKSYQVAAKQLSVSQPAVSIRIQGLEEHFKTKLVSRTSAGIILTSQGKSVYNQVLKILALWDELEGSFHGTEPKGKLHLGASTIPSEYLLPSIIKSYKGGYPSVQINMLISGTEEVGKWLFERKVDIAVTGKSFKSEEIISETIYTDEMKIIAPKEIQGLNEELAFQDLLQCDWVLRDPNSNTRKVLVDELEKQGLSFEDLPVVGQMGSTEAVIASVEAGLGISVVSSLAADRAYKQNRVQVLNVTDFQVTRPFVVSYLAENELNPMVSSFVAFLKEHLK